jgi:hypothetical protein
LLTFIAQSSTDLQLPLDFYILFLNQLVLAGDIYLKSLPKPVDGTYHFSDLLHTPYDIDYWITQRNLVNIILKFSTFGHSAFGEFHLLWELLFEQIRLEKYPNLPSRRHSYFLFGSVDDCQYYMQAHKIIGVIKQVELIETRSLVLADMRILDDLPSYATCKQAKVQADRYWSGQRSDHPVIEYLFQGICDLAALDV